MSLFSKELIKMVALLSSLNSDVSEAAENALMKLIEQGKVSIF